MVNKPSVFQPLKFYCSSKHKMFNNSFAAISIYCLLFYLSAGQKPGTTGPGVKGVDPEAEGIVNGVSVFEFNLDTLKDEEKPWRKPGKFRLLY